MLKCSWVTGGELGPQGLQTFTCTSPSSHPVFSICDVCSRGLQ